MSHGDKTLLAIRSPFNDNHMLIHRYTGNDCLAGAIEIGNIHVTFLRQLNDVFIRAAAVEEAANTCQA